MRKTRLFHTFAAGVANELGDVAAVDDACAAVEAGGAVGCG